MNDAGELRASFPAPSTSLLCPSFVALSSLGLRATLDMDTRTSSNTNRNPLANKRFHKTRLVHSSPSIDSSTYHFTQFHIRRNLFRSRPNDGHFTPRDRSRSPAIRLNAPHAPRNVPQHRRSSINNQPVPQQPKAGDSAGSSELTPTSSPFAKALTKPRKLNWADLYLQDSDDDDLFTFDFGATSSHATVDEDTLTSTPSKENKAIHANCSQQSNPPKCEASVSTAEPAKCDVFKAPNLEKGGKLVKGSSKNLTSSFAASSTSGSVLGAMETDMAVLKRRQKQIDYGKNTIGYQNYITLIPKEKRGKKDPHTPNKFGKFARRSFDSMIRVWRMKLHAYDPVDDGFNDNTELSEIFSDLSFDSKMFSSSPSRSSPVSSVSYMPSSPIPFSGDEFPPLPSSELGDYNSSEMDQPGADLLAEMDEVDFLAA